MYPALLMFGLGIFRSAQLRLLAGLIALFVASEPLIHTHPLTAHGQRNEASSVCATCAASSAKVTSAAPVFATPTTVVTRLVSVSQRATSASASPTLPSRAPPVA